MGTKFTFFIVPDDDSETRSFSLGKNFIKILIVVPIFVFIALSTISIIYVPKISDYNDLSQKYKILVSERMKVLDLTKSLEKITHMDQFVRNSLGADFNFIETPKIIDSALMVIPENNIISLSDNIPSFPPVEGFISQRMESTFSNIDEAHGGIDIVAKEGTPISSASSGVVVFSGWTYELGNLIILYHGGGYMTHYGHNQNNLVSRLDMVKRGDVIGYVGNTGISSGPHLHFEIWKGDRSIDPLIYFPDYLKKDLTFRN
tara:strand:- start:839 stop:1618 length:780 start_codon:yes stop_codon:yes gene_type:complete